ncbi:hypothetical protein BC826DRAFT_513985 [Russula brevipes]|nr:hypothetical protein BC826DRAFT_513985 [Russula brevipes]
MFFQTDHYFLGNITSRASECTTKRPPIYCLTFRSPFCLPSPACPADTEPCQRSASGSSANCFLPSQAGRQLMFPINGEDGNRHWWERRDRERNGASVALKRRQCVYCNPFSREVRKGDRRAEAGDREGDHFLP